MQHLDKKLRNPYGRFLVEVNDLSPRIVSYLNSQLELPPSLSIITPDRNATFSEHGAKKTTQNRGAFD